ncbi:MAG TPA: cyclic nucleotide-binding domain-containing protein [Acidimicrobiales bacterium]|nr:cyclic nucleotide-binding domain-containing protein [Acidimicrobiales bacterium]
MRIESSVTSLSWIPSEAIAGITAKLPFELGVAHYDETPPDLLGDLVALRDADRFRFANRLEAWAEVEDGKIVRYGQSGGGMIGSTTLRVGSKQATFQAIALPELRPEPVVSGGEVRFTQTAGGRTGVPAPRRVKRPPFVQIAAPLAWTTLALTIKADGTSSSELAGASTFPRHWIYGHDGALTAKSGLIDFSGWYAKAFGKHSPWGDEDSPALSTEVESAMERQLSEQLMRGATPPKIRKVKEGGVITEQGAEEDDVFLVLDGVVGVEVDGEPLAELGPGALLGERAILEGGRRTSTLRAVTACKLAVVPGDQLDHTKLAEVSTQHRREEQR